MSPDGSRLAYVHHDCDTGSVTVVVRTLVSGVERRIAVGNPPAPYGRPDWSPDNRHLALFLRGGGGVAYGIAVVDTEAATNLFEHPQSLRGPNCFQEQPRYLTDGSIVAVTCADEDHAGGTVAMRFSAGGQLLGPLFELHGVDSTVGLPEDQVISFAITTGGDAAIYQTRSSAGVVRTFVIAGETREVHTTASAIDW